jgi:hypothetical protein
MTRVAQLARTFVGLADTLVGHYDITDFLYLLCDRCAEVLAVDAAGVLVSDEEGRLRLTSASDKRMRVLELFEMQRWRVPASTPTGPANRSSSRNSAPRRAGGPTSHSKRPQPVSAPSTPSPCGCATTASGP